MVYFVDTNIAIGFSIFPDKHHNPCKDFISNTLDDIYWSDGVYEEFDEKFDELLEIIESFLDIISHSLNNKSFYFYNKDGFASFIFEKTSNIELDNVKKSKLIDVFWEEWIYGYSQDINELYEKFDDYSLYVPDLFNERKNLLIEKLICHNCGLDNYKNYMNLKNLLYENGVHNPDYKFVLDAHDLGKNKPVSFVTCDKHMVEAIISKGLLDKLCIKDFKVLN